MAALDNVQGAIAAGVTTATVAITVATGSILYGLVADLGDAATVTGVTYDAVAMGTVQATVDDSSSGVLMKGGVWGTVTPTTGSSKNMVATFSIATPGGAAIHAVAISGAITSSLAASHGSIFHAGDGGGGTGVDLTVTDSAAGDMVIAMSSAISLISSNQTVLRNDLNVAGGSGDLCSGYAIATGANQLMSFNGDDFCTNIAFAVKNGAAAAQTFYPRYTRPFPFAPGGARDRLGRF